MNLMMKYLLVLALSISSASALRSNEVTQLLTSLENSIPVNYRSPIAIVENDGWTKHPDFRKLQVLIKNDWPNQTAQITKLASSYNSQAIYFKAAQVLDEADYFQLILAAADRAAAGEIHPMQFKWVVFPTEKHLRDMWIEDPPSAELKKVAARVREVMADDPGMVRFMTNVMSGEIAATNRDFHPEANPLPKSTPTQGAPSAPELTPAPPPVAPAPAVVAVPAPAAPPPAKSLNPLWWIAGAIILVGGAVFLARKKTPSA